MALEKLHKNVPCSVPGVKIHITNLAAQTGVTRFGQICDNWNYDKTENLSPSQILDRDYTHLIAENHDETVRIFGEKYRKCDNFLEIIFLFFLGKMPFFNTGRTSCTKFDLK